MASDLCQTAEQFQEKWITEWPMIIEEKLDGMRVMAKCEWSSFEISITFLTRNGNEFNSLQHIADLLNPALQNIGGVDDGTVIIFDGEITNGEFNEGSGQIRRKSEQAPTAVYNVFDIIKPDYTYLQRRYELEQLLGDHVSTHLKINPCVEVNSVDEIHSLFQAVLKRGGEGLIVKDPRAEYWLRRHRSWMKLKGKETYDVKIKGALEGTGKYVGMLGKLVCDLDGVEVKVGGGFTDALRTELWEMWLHDEAILEAPEETFEPLKLVGRLIEASCHEKTPKGSLRHPNFVRFRDDK